LEPVCPYCEKKQSEKPIKKWAYGKTSVNRYECKCGKIFNHYVSPTTTWTIPKKGKKPEQKIEDYPDRVKRDVCKEMYGHRNIAQLSKGDYFEMMFKVKKLFGA